MLASTGMTEEPVVSRAMASIWSPRTPACFTAVARGFRQRPHMVFVRLGSVFRIFALAVQRVLGNRRCQQATLAVHDRHPNVQCPEIHPSNDRHDGSAKPDCASTSPTRSSGWSPRERPLRQSRSWRLHDARIPVRKCNEAASASAGSPPLPRRQRSPADRQ